MLLYLEGTVEGVTVSSIGIDIDFDIDGNGHSKREQKKTPGS